MDQAGLEISEWISRQGMAAVLLWCIFCETSAAERFFVDAGAAGLESGLTWEDAFVDLQPALDAALAGDEIWVACATYAPTERTDELDPRSARFEVRTGVSVFGGFLGGEEDLAQRDPDPFTNGCVLGGVDDPTGFFQLVHINNVPDSVLIDGFSFTQSTNLVEFGNRGVGIEVLGASLIGRNLLFSGLTTAGGFAGLGGAVFAENSDVELEDTVLRDVATGRGGIAALSSTLRANRLMVVDGRAGFGGGSALYANGSTEIEVFDGIFERGFGNNNGGAILADSGVIRLERCTFSENSARSGGAIFARSPAQVFVNNSTFVGNLARSGRGGAILGGSSTPQVITNATFALNEAGSGSGIFVSGSGGALVQNTVHLHMLFLDGAYVERYDKPRFRRVNAPIKTELEVLVHQISQRVGRHLERKGLLERDLESSHLTLDRDGDDGMNALLGHSITYRVAVGPRAGQKAFTLQTLPPLPERFDDDPPYLAKANGFSLPQGTLS